MNKTEFLNTPDVAKFIDWLSTDLPSRAFHLDILSSRFVPSGLKTTVTGIENILTNYRWHTYWLDTRTNEKIASSDWDSTKKSLSRLSKWLNDAVNSGDQKQTFDAARGIMNWGGVSGASNLLKELHKSNRLISYLMSVRQLLAVNGLPTQRISDISSKNILKFDSGLTKIHALHENDGSPIYDSRVAAAISLLYQLYRETAPSSVKSSLSFPCGSARGDQLRNPGDLGFKKSRAFYYRIADHEWAQTQLQLGWIFSDLLQKNPMLFQKEGDLSDRAHALEASLFVIGYDLRCFNVKAKPKTIPNKTKLSKEKSSNFGLVPTSHPFGKVIREFVRVQLQGVNKTNTEVASLMFPNDQYKASTAKSYLFPLSRTEFDLFDASVESLELLISDSSSWLDLEFNHEGFIPQDERKYVCLQDAWLVGYMNRNFPNRNHNSLLHDAGLCGAKTAASVIRTVGKDVGIFFNLLDKKGFPTTNFDKFFCQDMKDLESKLTNAARASHLLS